MIKFWREVQTLSKLAGPIVVTYLFQIALGMQAIFFVGHLGVTELAAGALGFMFVNVTGFSLMVGLLSALDSLGSQAFGSRQFHLVGILAQRGLFLCLALVLPVAILWCFAEPILLLLRLDVSVSRFTGVFVRWMLPSLPLYAGIETSKRYLQVQGIVFPILFITIFISFFNVAISYLFVFVFQLGFIGAPLALTVTNFAFLSAILGYIFRSRIFIKTWPGWRFKEAISNLGEFARLGIAGIAMTCAEWWAFEIQAIFAGWLGTLSLDAHTVLINLSSFFFMIPLGLSVAVSTRVGNELGANSANGARRSAIVALLVALPCQLSLSLLLYFTRLIVGRLFSGDDMVVRAVALLIPLLCGATIGDALQCLGSGILRGMARQNLGALVNLCVYYGFGLPISYFFAFTFHLDVWGLWFGLTISAWLQALIFLVAILRVNWREEALKAQKRTEKESVINLSDEAVELEGNRLQSEDNEVAL